MKGITKKAINRGLPRRDALRRQYRFVGETGWSNRYARTFRSAYIEVTDEGAVWLNDYSYGDAMSFKDYNGETEEVSNLVEDWVKGKMTRKEVIDQIYSLLREKGNKR